MKLYFVNGNRQGEYLKFVPPGICIGREADNDIQLLLPGISRYHAKIEFVQDDQWKIIDQGSTNGTRIDGQKISEPVILEIGMKITIGEQVMKITADNTDAEKDQAAAENAPNINNLHALAENVTMNMNLSSTPAKKDQQEPAIKINDNIFGKKSDSGNDRSEENPEQNRSKKRVSNLLFLLLVMILACAAVVIFAIINVPQQTINKEQNVGRPANPLLIEYEKKISSDKNIFRFYVRIENNSAIFKLDDLASERHFSKGIGIIEQEYLRTLTTEVKNTDFMKIQSDPPGKPQNNNTDEYRKLTVGYDKYLNTVVVRNNYPKLSFEAIEQALEQFASDYGLKTISLSVEEMRKEAENSFAKAEELLANYQAQPENLRNAILRYQITIDYLDQFNPKPEIWQTSKKKLAYALSLLQKLKKDAEFQINVFYKRRQYAEAIAECDRLMRILDSDDKAYQKLRNLKISLEKQLLSEKKRR